MNKTITIYELLGMIKDGKAPKKIKYNCDEWEYNIFQYIRVDRKDGGNLWDGYNFNILTDRVEILNEEDEFIEIEELLPSDVITVYTNGDKINQLIHNQKIIIEKMKEKE